MLEGSTSILDDELGAKEEAIDIFGQRGDDSVDDSDHKDDPKNNKRINLNQRLKDIIIDYQYQPLQQTSQQTIDNKLTKWTSTYNENEKSRYRELKEKLQQSEEINPTEQTITFNDRKIDGNKIILTCSNPIGNNNLSQQQTTNITDDQSENAHTSIHQNTEQKVNQHITLNTSINSETHKIEISTNTYKIKCTSEDAMKFYHKFNALSSVNGYGINHMSNEEAILLLKYEPLPFHIAFYPKSAGVRARVKECCGCSQNNQCMEILVKWLTKFAKLSLGVVSKASSLIDSVTDMILLYKAQNAGAIAFTMILFITLLAPYILSYSSGVQIFLYRKTFQNVQLFTFRSLLLGLYLFPTGIWFFILLDIVDALMETYKWFAFGLINKIRSQEALVQIESNCAEYFGMSRMDWISFKKQKLIAQLLLSTIRPFFLFFVIILVHFVCILSTRLVYFFSFQHFCFCMQF